MKRFCLIVTVATLLSGSAGVAQVNLPDMSAPNAGATLPSDYVGAPSPVGAMTTEASIGGAGIPLGTTELFAGGLSPAPTDAATANPTCPGASPIPGVGTREQVRYSLPMELCRPRRAISRLPLIPRIPAAVRPPLPAQGRSG